MKTACACGKPRHARPAMTAAILATLCCPACGSPLSVHQPDGRAPDRLLGTCDGCGRWSVWRPGPDGLMGGVLLDKGVDDFN